MNDFVARLISEWVDISQLSKSTVFNTLFLYHLHIY